MFAGGFFAVLILFIVDHLIFVTKRVLASFEHEVFQAAITTRSKFPFPLQLEMIILPVTQNISTPVAQPMQPSLLDGPTFSRKGRLLETMPPLHALAVKEKRPPLGLFRRGELVGFSPAN